MGPIHHRARWFLAACALLAVACPRAVARAGAADGGPATATEAVVGPTIDENGAWEELAPPRRHDLASVFDSARRRVILFGDDNPSVWAFPVDDPSAWTLLTRQGPGPGRPTGQCAVYDPIGDRVIALIAGVVYQLPLTGETTWSVRPTLGGPPGVIVPSVIYDALRHRIVVFGGDGYTTSEVWALSLNGPLSTWVQLEPAGTLPAPRTSASSIYDPVRDRMIVAFGYSGGESVSDCWALSFSPTIAWSQVAAGGANPVPRYDAAATYDPDGDRMLVYGGHDTHYSEGGLTLASFDALNFSGTPTWVGVLDSWSGPSGRAGAAFAYDPATRSAVLFGGHSDPDVFSDTWITSLASTPEWRQAAAAPPGRSRGSAVFDPERNAMVLFGGYANFCTFICSEWTYGDAYGHSDGTWQRLGGEGPARRDHSAIVDPIRHRMIVFGGYDLSIVLNDLWSLSLGDGPDWQRITPQHGPPPARSLHSAIYDPIRDRMIVFGGWSGDRLLADVWALSLGASPRWVELLPAGEGPPAREAHAAIYDPVRDRMVIFGGIGTSGGALADVWALDLGDDPRWTRIEASGASDLEAGGVAAYDPDRDRMLVVAGNRIMSLDFAPDPRWHALSPAGVGPAQLPSRFLTYDPVRRRLLLTCGGAGYGVFYDDVWALNLGRPRRARPGVAAENAIVSAPLPNPMRDVTRLAIELARPGPVRAIVYAVDGRRVAAIADSPFEAGLHDLVWDGRDATGLPAPSGMYWLRVEVNGRRTDHKVVRLR